MDERSKLLNTEMGIIVDCPPLAKAVDRFFDTAARPDNAYQVRLDPTKPAKDASLQWLKQDGDQTAILDKDPDATTARRVEVNLIKLLPIEGLL